MSNCNCEACREKHATWRAGQAPDTVRAALLELTAAIEGEAKAKRVADVARENYSDPSREDNAFFRAMLRVCEAMKQAKAALAVPEQAPETPDALAEFTAYFVKNYPADTIICNPEWHAPRIFRAAQYAMRAAPAALPDGKDAERFRFWFSPAAKAVDMNGYLQGIREGWTTEQWREFTDAAIQAQTEGERHE